MTVGYVNGQVPVFRYAVSRDNYDFFKNPSENVRQTKAFPDIDTLLLYTFREFNTSIDLLKLSMHNGTLIIVFTIYLYTKRPNQPWTTSLYFNLTFCQAGSIVVGHA